MTAPVNKISLNLLKDSNLLYNICMDIVLFLYTY